MKTQHSVQYPGIVYLVCSGRENVKCYCCMLCVFLQFLGFVLDVKINSRNMSL